MPTLLPALIALLGLQAPPAGALAYTAPASWQSRAAASTMRVAEFVIPRTAGDREDAELVVYYFGGSGGSVEANIERWIAQLQQPDGSSSSRRAQRGAQTVNGLKVSTVDLSGTYIAELRPGATERHNKPGFPAARGRDRDPARALLRQDDRPGENDGRRRRGLPALRRLDARGALAATVSPAGAGRRCR